MANCKECIKSNVCRYNDGVNLWCKGDCPKFEDKNRYLKLPCNVGDYIWFLKNNILSFGKINNFTIGNDNRLFADVYELDDENDEIEGEFTLLLTNQIGKTVFTTYEEVKEWLEEKKNNE